MFLLTSVLLLFCPVIVKLHPIMDYNNIDNDADLRSYLKKFREKGFHVIALDIEAECNCHAYGESLCLVQIFDGVNSVIIDPFGISNKALKLLFEDPNILKVMYDAGSDLSLMKNSADIEIKSILDLRPATEILDYEKKDLHSVIAFELGIMLEKKRKYQRHNWTKRPIAGEAIDYAINDVTHLFALKDIIMAKLFAKKLFELFLLKNLQVQCKDYTRAPEDKYRKISGYSRLQDDKKAVFRKVFNIREKYAKKYNMPPHNVIQKSDLINIVKDPQFINKMKFTKRFGTDLVKGIQHDLKTAFRMT